MKNQRTDLCIDIKRVTEEGEKRHAQSFFTPTTPDQGPYTPTPEEVDINRRPYQVVKEASCLSSKFKKTNVPMMVTAILLFGEGRLRGKKAKKVVKFLMMFRKEPIPSRITTKYQLVSYAIGFLVSTLRHNNIVRVENKDGGVTVYLPEDILLEDF